MDSPKELPFFVDVPGRDSNGAIASGGELILEFKGICDGDLESVLDTEEDAENARGTGEEGATDFDPSTVVADGDDGEGMQGYVAPGSVAPSFLAFQDEVVVGVVGCAGRAAASSTSSFEVHGCRFSGPELEGLLSYCDVVCAEENREDELFLSLALRSEGFGIGLVGKYWSEDGGTE